MRSTGGMENEHATTHSSGFRVSRTKEAYLVNRITLGTTGLLHGLKELINLLPPQTLNSVHPEPSPMPSALTHPSAT